MTQHDRDSEELRRLCQERDEWKAKALSKWRTIDSAPKEGRFLVYVPIEGHRQVIAMRGFNGIFLDERAQPIPWPPQMWQPLPPPPGQEKP